MTGLSRTFTFPFENSSIYDLQRPELPNRCIIYMNGLGNNFHSAQENASYLSSLAGGHNIRGVHSSCYNLKYDLQRARLGLNNKATEPVRLAQQLFDDYFQHNSPDATILLQVHSRGAIDARLALAGYNKNLRKRIYVLAIAPAAYIDPETCGTVIHYRSKDPVANIDTVGARMFAHTIRTLIPHPEASQVFDHPLQSPTYEVPLQHNLRFYLKTGRLQD